MSGVIAGISVAALASSAQIISGAKRAKQAKQALRNFQRQELKNVTKGMRVSTMGAELQTREAQRRFTTSVDALRSGGVRGLVGGMGQVEQQQQMQQQQIAAGLDQQQVSIDRMAAQDEANMRQVREQRDNQAIQGMGAELAAGRAQVSAGISGIAQAGVSMATMGLGSGAGEVAGTVSEGAAKVNQAGLSALNAGSQASLALGNNISAMRASKQSSFTPPSQLNNVNPYAPQQQYELPKADFSNNPFN
jgi:hypothetical protein